MVKGTEDDDFKKLQRLGFNFDGPRDEDEFQSQPASGSMIGGVRGEMEYGIHEDITLMEPDEPVPVDELEAGDLEYDPDPISYGDPRQELVGTSEWSNSAAFHPDEIVERAESVLEHKAEGHQAEGAVTRSSDVTVPRTYRKGRKSDTGLENERRRKEGEQHSEGDLKGGVSSKRTRSEEPEALWSGFMALAGCAFCGAALALGYCYTVGSFTRRSFNSRSRSLRRSLWS